jgi:hypothetical protein
VWKNGFAYTFLIGKNGIASHILIGKNGMLIFDIKKKELFFGFFSFSWCWD